MRFSWPIVGVAIGGFFGVMLMPADLLGRPGPWWRYAVPMFGGLAGLVLGVMADRFNIR